MTIGPLPAATGTAREHPQNSPDSAAWEQAAKDRELAKAIRALNENAVFGPGSEVRFAIDQDTGRRLIRIVDRVTNEVLSQYPTEELLRMAKKLSELEDHNWLA
jgi:flagellar protein FlaG